jgi:hypothetical protein
LRPERDAYGRLILEYLETGEGIDVEVIDEGEHLYVGVLEWVR